MRLKEPEPILPPVNRDLLRAELTPDRKVRDTHKAGNEIYIFAAGECPALMREVGRLREMAFRGAGGGTGREVDIDEEDLAHVFDRFYRADKSRTNTSDTSSSHGLGLAIAHAIAEEHGGTLTAESTPEEGTTFIAELPLK